MTVKMESPTECEPCGEIWDAANWVTCPRCQITALRDALDFYADPETYFGIGFFGDRPCGPFVEDFSETSLSKKPGNAARLVLAGKALPTYAQPDGSVPSNGDTPGEGQ